MKKETATAFEDHLERIKLAKNTASLWEQMTLAEKSMGILWEQLFDQLCVESSAADLAPVKDLAGILSKLLQNYRQLFAICRKTNVPANEDNPWLLSENVLKEIEDQLQLL